MTLPKLYLIIILFVFLVGCISHQNRVPPTIQAGSPTSTEDNLLSLTIIPSKPGIDVSEATSIPLPVLTVSATSTLTPKPTLTSQDLQANLLDLYEHNWGCDLPCWWGLSPGSTPWDEARSFLEPLAIKIWSSAPKRSYTSFEVYVPSEKPDIFSSPRTYYYRVKNGMIVGIEMGIKYLSPYDNVVEMLMFLGRPNEIWIRTGTRDEKQTKTQFHITLFYPDQGIFAWYSDDEAKVTSDTIVGCPQLPGLGNSMKLWNPEQDIPYSELIQTLALFPKDEKYLPLQEVTGISIDEFYRLMTESLDPPCLATPRDIWRQE